MITTQQLEERRNHIGSSDVSAIMGINPWRGPREVWASKVLEVEQSSGADTARGIRLEPLILDQAQKELGIEILRDRRIVSRQDALFAANLDGFLEESRIPVEAKAIYSTTDEWDFESDDGVPPVYIMQAQHQMYCCEANECKFAVAIPNMRALQFDLHIMTIKRDDEIIRLMLEKCRYFWDSYVVPKIPPPDAAVDASFWRRVSRIPDSSIEISASLVSDYEHAVLAAREADKTVDECKAAILSVCGAAESASCAGKVVFKPQFTNRFDSKVFRENHPDMYEQYVRPTSSIRFFTVKGKS